MLNIFKISYILMSHVFLYEDNSFLACASHRTYMYMEPTIFIMVNKNAQRPGVISTLIGQYPIMQKHKLPYSHDYSIVAFTKQNKAMPFILTQFHYINC